ncbi:MAG: hypothetical protein FWG85_08205 [Bacteroidetes bacterium]|nr:hypothetical protein [Bacteroidota bacterium]
MNILKEKLPQDASKSLNIRLKKEEFEFINRIYNANPIYFRSYTGVIREGLQLLKSKNVLKQIRNNKESLWI